VLKAGLLSKDTEKGKSNTNYKACQRNTTDQSKFRPISLINVGGKVLEKILINIIINNAYTNNLLNQNQFGFTPKKSKSCGNNSQSVCRGWVA